MKLTKLFTDLFESEKAGGLILIFCTIISLLIANSSLQTHYTELWHINLAGLSLAHWINDGLMTIFFLLIGLELEREMYHGELSDLKSASLPAFAALGGMIVPACIFLLLNFGTNTQSGAGIPMATDIAFAVGVISLLGNKIPTALKVFLMALAIIDDLGAIIVIAIFYTSSISFLNLIISLSIFGLLLLLNRLKIYNLIPYIIGGIAMWYFMLHSGVHATITGVLLAFAIPFGNGDERSTSYKLQHFLHKPVAFFILPIFALANTCIVINSNWYQGLAETSSIGIIAGLVIGKPLGICLFVFIATYFKLSSLGNDIKWSHIVGAGLLAGIGFTMSIFITLLAFEKPEQIDLSKIAILVASLIAGIAGFMWLKFVPKRPETLV
ncbi:MAG: Na+/H+ antiporter NhaA [Bacteroidia bacterium]|nr:Na+/H+ antiporter NhaA [Bacteroidia bacterium]